MNRTDKALAFATEKHFGQVDKSGLPYIGHPVHVADGVFSDSEKIVALLHDVLEDTDATEDELLSLGVTEEELAAIKLLTHDKNEPYLDYIRRISENELAKAVKIQDLKHNMDLKRLGRITEKDMQRNQKYEKAMMILQK